METKNELKENITAKPEERSDEQIPAVIGCDEPDKTAMTNDIRDILEDYWYLLRMAEGKLFKPEIDQYKAKCIRLAKKYKVF